jgi:D-glycero-D-manno-heptose 1,7-bisphosphate phosphatase
MTGGYPRQNTPPEIRIREHAAISRPKGDAARPALILDRDGVLVEERHHLSRPEDVRLAVGAADLIRAVRDLGLPVCVVTNQSGIDRKLFTWADFEAVSTRIDEELAAQGGSIDVTIACPFHPEFTAGYGEDHAYWRKPGPGMLHLLAARFGVDLNKSIFVGDNVSDAEAGQAAGLSRHVHVLTGHGRSYEDSVRRRISGAGFSTRVARDLSDCSSFIKEFLRSNLN